MLLNVNYNFSWPQQHVGRRVIAPLKSTGSAIYFIIRVPIKIKVNRHVIQKIGGKIYKKLEKLEKGLYPIRQHC